MAITNYIRLANGNCYSALANWTGTVDNLSEEELVALGFELKDTEPPVGVFHFIIGEVKMIDD